MLQKLKKIVTSWQRDDRGIAILFTLGILSLLLIMALSFATDAIIERKVAYNTNSRMQARILAQSGLNRAIAAMKYYNEFVPGASFNYIVSGYKPTSTDIYTTASDSDFQEDSGRAFTLCPNSTTLNNTTSASNDHAEESFSGLGTGNNIYWQYVREKNSDTSSRIIGRYAYAVCTDTGRIDAAAIVDTTKTNDYNNNIYGANYPESSTSKIRPGVDISEIYASGLANGTNTFTSWDKLGSKDVNPNGWLLDGHRWNGIEELMSLCDSSYNASRRAYFSHYFSIYNQPDPEAYWADANNDGILNISSTTPAKYELYHRFNLNRNDWSTMTVDQMLCNGTSYVPVKFNTTFSSNAGLQYLRKMTCSGSNPAGNYSSVEYFREQVAANIIDYCNGMSAAPTSNVANASWSNADIGRPKYTGNKRTYYINEIGVDAYAEMTKQSVTISGTAYKYYQFTPAVTLGGELINIFTSGKYDPTSNPWGVITDKYELTVYGYLAYDITAPGMTELKTSDLITPTPSTVDSGSWIPFSETITFSTDTASYKFAWATTPQNPAGTLETNKILDTDPDPAFNVSLSVKLDCAVLKAKTSSNGYPSSDINVDFSDFRKADTSVDPRYIYTSTQTVYESAIATSTATSRHMYAALEANDPRQNLNYSDWKNFSESTQPTTPTYPGTPNAVNSGVSPKYSATTTPLTQDPETVTDPAYSTTSSHLSTAFIRHAPMITPWELGCISRGYAWQTINLMAFHPLDNAAAGNGKFNYLYYDSSNTATPGDLSDTTVSGTYALGDAGILDQVKMTSLCKSYGKVDINSQDANVWSALLTNIYLDDKYNSLSATSGVVMSSAHAGTLLSKVSNNVSTMNRKFSFQQRAEIAPAAMDTVIDSSVIGSNATKAQIEALIGKFINLTQAGVAPSEIRVMVVAQTIRDTGSSDGSGISITKNIDGTNVPKKCYIGKFEYTTDSKGNIVYFDEITGEQKVYAVVSRDPLTNKFVIKRIEYLQE